MIQCSMVGSMAFRKGRRCPITIGRKVESTARENGPQRKASIWTPISVTRC